MTHHHSDHNLELGPLLYNAWAAGLRTPIDVYAPTGLVVPLQLAVRCYGLTNESSWRSALC
ncbi:hypothetical protein QA636_12000 [Bradyrhizobium brasilense]|uniref:Metallo-beta-lactamase domain-containing protein n=1 Tax=Bradyrhizobium brasilense TaxID=1419277 RepID=A0ABY8JUF1_9BRAD|nr:hypothetical protein QA636_12000 [Bradyrhizobium brasilense]